MFEAIDWNYWTTFCAGGLLGAFAGGGSVLIVLSALMVGMEE